MSGINGLSVGMLAIPSSPSVNELYAKLTVTTIAITKGKRWACMTCDTDGSTEKKDHVF